MKKNSTLVRKFNMNHYERAAMRLFDRDLPTDYPQISDDLPVRAQLVRDALQRNQGSYELCRRVVKVARPIHNSNTQRFPVTINRSMQMLAADHTYRKPTAQAAARSAAA